MAICNSNSFHSASVILENSLYSFVFCRITGSRIVSSDALISVSPKNTFILISLISSFVVSKTSSPKSSFSCSSFPPVNNKLYTLYASPISLLISLKMVSSLAFNTREASIAKRSKTIKKFLITAITLLISPPSAVLMLSNSHFSIFFSSSINRSLIESKSTKSNPKALATSKIRLNNSSASSRLLTG